MKFSQYIPLTACPPLLALISLHESADSSGMAPRIAKKLKKKKKRRGEEKMRNLPLQDNQPNHFALTLTSLPISSEVISLRVGYKIFRPGFLCAVTQFTLVLGEHIVKALASDVTITFPQTHITECCSSDCFKNVFLKHLTKDGDFTCITLVLSNN